MNASADSQSDHRSETSNSTTPPAPAAVRQWKSGELLGEATEAHIVHGHEVYRLLRTRNDKLILVK
jgi:hemin uptake protein HemP